MKPIIIVWAIKDIDNGLFWNRIHKDFRPLSQNTLFCKSHTMVEYSMHNASCIRQEKFEGHNIKPVMITISE